MVESTAPKRWLGRPKTRTLLPARRPLDPQKSQNRARTKAGHSTYALALGVRTANTSNGPREVLRMGPVRLRGKRQESIDFSHRARIPPPASRGEEKSREDGRVGGSKIHGGTTKRKGFGSFAVVPAFGRPPPPGRDCVCMSETPPPGRKS